MFHAVAGDVWYFPANLPHSFVGLEPDGCLFVSGYKSPDFDELKAFSASSWLATLPVDTLAQAGSCCTDIPLQYCILVLGRCPIALTDSHMPRPIALQPRPNWVVCISASMSASQRKQSGPVSSTGSTVVPCQHHMRHAICQHPMHRCLASTAEMCPGMHAVLQAWQSQVLLLVHIPCRLWGCL